MKILIYFGGQLATTILLNPLFIFIRSSGWVYIWAIVILDYTLTFDFTVCSKVWTVIVMRLRIKLLIDIWEIVLVWGHFTFPITAATFLPFILALFFFDFLRVLWKILEVVFVHVHLAIFYLYLYDIVFILILDLVKACLFTNELIYNAPNVLVVFVINLVALVLLSFNCMVSFFSFSLLYYYQRFTILFFLHLNAFLININYFLIWHCLNRCWIFILLYLLFILLDNSFFALLPSWAIGFNRTWNWILKMVFRLHNFFSC